MPNPTSEGTATDFVVLVARDEGQWSASALPTRVGDDLDGLVRALRQEPSDVGTFGFVSVADDFFVAVRVDTHGELSLLLSDATAASEWPVARQVLDELDLPEPDDEEIDDVQPVGNLHMFDDLGLDARELGTLLGDLDLYPDEMLSGIARRLGFGEAFERAVDVAMG